MSVFNAKILKGGALLEDSGRLVDVWDSTCSTEDNLASILEGNLLAKRSRTRSADVLRLVLKPRLIDPGSDVIATLKLLRTRPDAFREACYYEAGRDDRLLAAFAEGPLFEWYEAGRVRVSVAATETWLQSLQADRTIPGWNQAVQVRVAQGLLAAVRDFGVLEGVQRKRFAPPRLSMHGFAYVAYREHQSGRSSRAVVEGSVWRRWLLDQHRVFDLFGQADRLGLLRYSRAGSALRIDWRAQSLQEVARAAA